MGVSPGAARPTTAPLPGLARGCRRRRSATGSRWAASANSRVGAGKALTALVLHKHCLSIKQATSIVPDLPRSPTALQHPPARPPVSCSVPSAAGSTTLCVKCMPSSCVRSISAFMRS